MISDININSEDNQNRIVSDIGIENSISDLSDIKAKLEVLSQGIIHVVPENVGVLNTIKRARQYTDIKWTPVADVKRISSLSNEASLGTGKHEVFQDVFKASVEYTGIPYSETEADIGPYGYSNVLVGLSGCGLDTFVTAVENPYSVIYEESVYSPIENGSACYYGSICSGLLSYAYGFDHLIRVNNFTSLPGMIQLGLLIDNGIRYDIENIKLGDMLYKYNVHVALITDFVLDYNGDVKYIEVSETTKGGVGCWTYAKEGHGGGQTGGISRRLAYTIDEFFKFWDGYTLYRYSNIDQVTYEANPYVPIGNELKRLVYHDLPCMPYMGNNFVYKAGYIPNSDILCYNINYPYLKVLKDGTEWNSNGTADPYIVADGKATVDFTAPGNYEAYLCKIRNGLVTNRTISCHWSVI